MRKLFFLAMIVLLGIVPAKAQVDDDITRAMSDFQRFRDSIHNDFESFRRQANEEYARFMEEEWKPFSSQPALPVPRKPKPPQPVVADPETRPTMDPIPFAGQPIVPKPIDNPQPLEPIKMRPRPNEPVESFHFFGTPMKFHFDKEHYGIVLKDLSEKSVAATWKQLSGEYYDNIIAECLQNRKERNLCDWAYYLLTKQVAEKSCGGASNEAIVMQMYLLTQSGYKVRLSRSEDRLCILLGSEETLYRYKFFTFNSGKFYVMDPTLGSKAFYIYDHSFPKETSFSLAISQPKLTEQSTEDRTLKSKKYPELTVTLATNKNLIDFLDTYPVTDNWHLYSKASLSDLAKEDLYPALKAAIKDKTETEAASILLNFVQTGFQYETDQEQFGYERPLFPDESIYYPYCDCEDRSILYSCLVRELLGLEVVLLNFPEHLATAVHFNETVPGDYIEVEGTMYTICDPTYIGAPIGRCMPDLKTVMPIVVRF